MTVKHTAPQPMAADCAARSCRTGSTCAQASANCSARVRALRCTPATSARGLAPSAACCSSCTWVGPTALERRSLRAHARVVRWEGPTMGRASALGARATWHGCFADARPIVREHVRAGCGGYCHRRRTTLSTLMRHSARNILRWLRRDGTTFDVCGSFQARLRSAPAGGCPCSIRTCACSRFVRAARSARTTHNVQTPTSARPGSVRSRARDNAPAVAAP